MGPDGCRHCIPKIHVSKQQHRNHAGSQQRHPDPNAQSKKSKQRGNQNNNRNDIFHDFRRWISG